MKEPITWKEMKNGMAAVLPQLPSAIEHLPLASSFIASAITDDQPSPVRHCSSSKKALLKVSKLRWPLMPPCASEIGSPWATYVNMLTPSTE